MISSSRRRMFSLPTPTAAGISRNTSCATANSSDLGIAWYWRVNPWTKRALHTPNHSSHALLASLAPRLLPRLARLA